MKKDYVYMAVSYDEFELPLAIGESIEELANILNINKTTLIKALHRKSPNLKKTMKYIKVEFEEDEIKEKPKMKRKRWTDEEKEQLKELIGIYNYEIIAQKLNRTAKAVIEMRLRLNLDEPINATEYLNSAQLAECLGRSPCTIRKWISKKNLPHKKKILAKEREFYRIDTKEFWEWAEQHKELMRFDLYRLGNIPNEPKWVIEAKKKAETPKRRKWNNADDANLLFYYNRGLKLSEIAIKLDRSEKAIDQRLIKLKIKRKNIQLNWKKEEEAILIQMRKEGKSISFIADELGRSIDGVNYKFRHIKEKLQANL